MVQKSQQKKPVYLANCDKYYTFALLFTKQ
jgi:hypothetical protein